MRVAVVSFWRGVQRLVTTLDDGHFDGHEMFFFFLFFCTVSKDLCRYLYLTRNTEHSSWVVQLLNYAIILHSASANVKEYRYMGKAACENCY